jgi:glycosyltransferase involved in cell wall biosynthesis
MPLVDFPAHGAMSKSKLLLCHNYYQQAGGESVVFDTERRGLEAQGHPVITYTRDNSEIEEMNGLEKAALVASGYFSLRTRRDLAGLVARERPAAAIVQNVFPLISPSAYTTLHALGVPVIQAVYNYRLVCPAGELYSRGEICERCVGGNYLHCVARRCYRDSAAQSAWYASILGLHRAAASFTRCIDVFMVPDEFLGAKLVAGGVPAGKIRRNVNPMFLPPAPPAPHHDGWLLFVGRFVPQKGVRTLLRAMALMRGPGRLRLVGQGELEPEVRAAVTSPPLAGRVELIGPRWGEELDELMSGAAAVVVPSEWYDNLPHVVCQAGALGKPVVASRIDGIPEHVREDVSGFLFPPGDAEALARSMERVLALSPADYAALSRRCRAHAEQAFDFDVHYRTLRGILDGLGGPRAGQEVG